MKEAQKRSRVFSFTVTFLFHALIMTYPLSSFLWRRGYPFVTAETGILFLVLAATALVFSIVLVRTRFAVSILSAAVVTGAVVLIQFNAPMPIMLTCALIAGLLVNRLRSRFYFYGLPVVLALTIGAYFDSQHPTKAAFSATPHAAVDPDLPLIVHIVLDSMASIDSLPSYQATPLIKGVIEGFLEEFEFQVFPRAYSRHASTGGSMYSAFNFSSDDSGAYLREVMNGQDHVLRRNAYFEHLKASGYRLSIYQTEYIDFCRSDPDLIHKCWEYMQPNMDALRAFDDLSLKTRMLAGTILKQSDAISELLVSHSWLINRVIPFHDPKIFTELASDILQQGNGYVYFAHVLLPHGPFSYLNDCSINTFAPAVIRSAGFENESIQDEAVYEARNLLYFEQIDCALSSLARLFNEMKRVGLFDQATIIIHGDHGSLIGKHLPRYSELANLDPADLRAHFGVFFAFKSPFGEYRSDPQLMPLESLIEAVSEKIETQSKSPPTGRSSQKLLAAEPEAPEAFIFLEQGAQLIRVDTNIYENP